MPTVGDGMMVPAPFARRRPTGHDASAPQRGTRPGFGVAAGAGVDRDRLVDHRAHADLCGVRPRGEQRPECEDPPNRGCQGRPTGRPRRTQRALQGLRRLGSTVSIRLADSELNGETVSTECYTIEVASSQSAEEMRFGVATTRVGFLPPAGLAGEPSSDRFAPIVDDRVAGRGDAGIRDGQDLVAQPAGAHAQPALASGEPDGRRVPDVHRVLPRHLCRHAHAHRSHVLHVGDLLLRTGRQDRCRRVGGGRRRCEAGVYHESGGRVLRAERAVDPQHLGSRRHVGARSERPRAGRQHPRRRVVAVQHPVCLAG